MLLTFTTEDQSGTRLSAFGLLEAFFCLFERKKRVFFKNVNLAVAVAPKAYAAPAQNHVKKKKNLLKAVHIT